MEKRIRGFLVIIKAIQVTKKLIQNKDANIEAKLKKYQAMFIASKVYFKILQKTKRFGSLEERLKNSIRATFTVMDHFMNERRQ